MKRILILAFLCCLIAPLVHAQVRPKISSKQTHHRANASSTRGKLPRYGGAHRSLIGINYHLIRKASRPQVTVPLTAPARTKRFWFDTTKRNFKAWRLRHKHRKLEQVSLQKEREAQALAQAKANLPALQTDQAFRAESLHPFVPVLHEQPIPSVPFVAQPGEIAFRGLALSADGNSIRNILTNGLRTQDVKANNSALLHSISAGTPGLTRQLSHFSVISITHHPNKAAKWGEIRSHAQSNPILTIVKIKGDFRGKSTEFITKDIPVSDIEEVIVQVNVNGNLTWCKVELNTDNTFTLIPYKRTLE